METKKKLLIRKCLVSKITVFMVFELAITQLKLPAKRKQRYTGKQGYKKSKIHLKKKKKKQRKI